MTKKELTEIRDDLNRLVDALSKGGAKFATARAVERLDAVIASLPDEPKAPTAINAEGSRLMMELFNRMPVKALKEVPENIARSIGDFMVANGYRFVFDRWHLQAEPKEPERSALNREASHGGD